MLDKTPQRHPAAFPLTVLLRLPSRLSVPSCRFRHCSVSGFPLACLSSRIPCADPSHRRELVGLPRSFVRFSSCMPRPVDSGGPSHPRLPTVGCSRIAFGERPNPRRPRSQISKLYQLFRARGHPCGLQDSLSTLRPNMFVVAPTSFPYSALDARLDTGGWLSLTRQGLSPRKKRQGTGART